MPPQSEKVTKMARDKNGTLTKNSPTPKVFPPNIIAIYEE